MGYFNPKRYLISSPKTNHTQNLINKSKLVQEIWNRMWSFSPLAQQCGLFISKDIVTPPTEPLIYPWQSNILVLVQHATCANQISRVIEMEGIAPDTTGELSKLCCKEDHGCTRSA